MAEPVGGAASLVLQSQGTKLFHQPVGLEEDPELQVRSQPQSTP